MTPRGTVCLSAAQMPILSKKYLSWQRGRNGPVANTLLDVVGNHAGAPRKGGARPGDGALGTLLGAWDSVKGKKQARDSLTKATNLYRNSVRRSQKKKEKTQGRSQREP